MLCLFVRISAPDTESPKYIATEVTSNQVSRYMKRRLGLRTIFKNHSCYLANINGKGVELQETPSFKLTQEMKLSNMFDPEYCYDSLKLKMFLRRYDNNEYKV